VSSAMRASGEEAVITQRALERGRIGNRAGRPAAEFDDGVF